MYDWTGSKQRKTSGYIRATEANENRKADRKGEGNVERRDEVKWKEGINADREMEEDIMRSSQPAYDSPSSPDAETQRTSTTQPAEGQPAHCGSLPKNSMRRIRY